MSAPRLASVAITLAALALVGCGDEGESAASGPASFVPADSPMAFEVSRESADQVGNAEALIERLGEVPLLGASLDPRDLIQRAIDESAAEEGVDISFAEDIEPWIGDRAVIGITSVASLEESVVGEAAGVSSEDPDFVIAIEATDESLARDAIDRIIAAEEPGEVEEAEVGGQTVKRVLGDEGGLALVDGSVVMGGTDAALEAAFSAHEGESLAEQEEYEAGFEGLPSERLAGFYLDFGVFLELSAGDADAEEIEAVRALYGDALTEPIAVTLSAGENYVALDGAAGILPTTFPAASPSELLDDASAASLAAVGLDDVGGQLKALYDQILAFITEAEPDGLEPDSFAAGLEAQLGMSVEEATGAFGDGVAYVRGELPDRFAVGIEFELPGSSDAPLQILDRVRQELEASDFRIGPPLNELGSGFSAERIDDEGVGFVNAEIGSDSAKVLLASDRATAAAGSAETLADGELYSQAETLLGDEFELIGLADPAAIIDTFIEGGSLLDVVTGEASPEQAVVDFVSERLEVAALGSRESDGRAINRLVLGIR